jgi:hypothetical protein
MPAPRSSHTVPTEPFIPAQAGIQFFLIWVPAFAGTNGIEEH